MTRLPPRWPHRSRVVALLAAWAVFFLAALSMIRPALAGPQDGLPPADAELDRSTPRRALRLLIDEARAGRYDLAARALDLSAIPPARQAEEGPRLARELKVVLDRNLWVVWDDISDDPAGKPEDGASTDQIGTLPLGTASVPVSLQRVTGPGGAPIWLVSRSTVAAVPELYRQHGPGFIGERLPAPLRDIRLLEMALWQWMAIPVALLLAWIGGVLLARIALGAAGRLARRTETSWDDRLLGAARNPLRVLLTLLLTAGLVQPLRLSVPAQNAVDRILETLFILSVAWLVSRVIGLTGDLMIERLVKRHGDEAAARGDKTRVTMLRRIATVAVVLVAASLVLLQFEVVRQVGVSLLASAGIAGVVLGFAAQKSIATLLAGLQLSISESVRIGDTVIVEGEWGQIEEITLTYVVVKIWDLRRLVIPITYFLEKPFQNWTKVSPELLGTVFVHADYTVPVEKVREEVKRICKESPLWDGKAVGLIVADATPETVSLRALVSAENAGKQWDLRCLVREGMVKFLQELDGGRYLPKSRVALAAPPNPAQP